MQIKNRKSFNNLIKSLTEEILEEDDLDEMTSTGNVAGYMTPMAFDPEGENKKKSKKNSYRKKIGEALEGKDIEISADNKIEVDNENGVMIVSGNAFVKEGQTSLKADILTAFTCETKNGDTKVIQVNADNNVIIISDQGKAFANRGIYFVEEKIIELYEKVKLEKDGDILVGDKGIFNVITGKGEISIDPDNKGKKRKVYGIIRSKNRKK